MRYRLLAMFISVAMIVGCVGEVAYAAEYPAKSPIVMERDSEDTPAEIPEAVSEDDVPDVSDGNITDIETEDGQDTPVAVDISDQLLQDGGLLQQPRERESVENAEGVPQLYQAVDEATYQKAEADLLKAYDSFATECDLSQYQIPVSDIGAFFAEVINTNPRYFYVSSTYSYYKSSGYVTRMLLYYDYDESQAREMLQKYDEAVNLALNGASLEWSDMEKALYINDYLTRNCQYDLTYSRYSAYDVFVDKTAVCQGYALAYLQLSKSLGVACELVTSDSLNHAWNLIEINGKYYLEDATWNDPVQDRIGRARHKYFMKSLEYYKTEDADHFDEDDWILTGGRSGADATDTSYDACVWHGIDTAFEYINGTWYGLDSSGNIAQYVCDGSSFTEGEDVLQLDNIWYVWGSTSRYWTGSYRGIAQYGGKLFYSTTDSIYSLDVSTKATEKVYQLTDAEKAVGYMYGMHLAPTGELYYLVAQSPNEAGTVYTVTDFGEDSTDQISYKIAFDGNGSTSGTMNSMNNCKYGTNYTLTANAYARSGYTFTGWNTKADGSGTTYADKASVRNLTATNKATVTLYAKWTANTYTIRFEGNGATAGTTSDLTCKYNESYSLTANGYTRSGYSFTGWNTKADGSGTTYADKASVRNLTATNKATVTLYAQWSRGEYTITYELNGGTNSSANPGGYNVSDATIILQDPTREGYIFLGWYSDSAYTTKVTQITQGSTGNKTLYAQWTESIYTIKFEGNGATAGSTSSLSCKYGTNYTLTANAYARSGYTFTGWNTKADGSGTTYADKASVKNLTAVNKATVTLYAKWTINTYTITYNLNGGINNSGNPTTYTVATDTITLKNPTKTGYTFAGWYSDSACTTRVTQISKGSTGNKSLYAKWTANKYTVKFNGNGASKGKMAALTNRVYDQSYKLKANSFTRKGYTFKSWNTQKNGQGTTYKNKATIKNLTTKNNKSVTLYAQWKPITYKITYNLNGGRNDKNNPKTYTVATKTITLKKPTKKGYTFAGWYSDKKLTKKVTKIQKGSTGNVKLYAKWVKK